MKKIEYAILIILFLYEVLFPFTYYTKVENKEYLKQSWMPKHSIELQSEFYQKSYLMPNGKYVDVADTVYSQGIIPVNIIAIAKKTDSLNYVDLLSRWAVYSNWGIYSFGNNPFGLEFNDVKQTINIPNTAVVLTKKYKWTTTKDSSYYKLSFVKLASFESMEEGFKTYNTLIQNNKLQPTDKENMAINKVKDDLLNEKKFKDKTDTMKVNFFKADTVSVSDSIYIVTMKDNVDYTKHYLPNVLLLGFIFFILIKYKKYFI